MDYTPILVLVISFICLLAIGTPVAWSISISSLLTMLVSIPALPALTTVSQRMATGLDSFALLAIPFFVLSGQLMNKGGIAHRLIAFAKTLVGSLPGGLALINIIAAMLMGAIAGSAMASASAMGSILGPEMEKEGYSKEFGVAVNITSATTGLVIPPSNVLIVYSLASGGVSIAALFLAGYIPGILTGFFLMIVAYFWAKKKGYNVGKRSSLKEVVKTFWSAFPSLMLLVVIMGGIVMGIFTATEASAIAVLYTLILGFYYKEITWRNLPEVLPRYQNSGCRSRTGAGPYRQRPFWRCSCRYPTFAPLCRSCRQLPASTITILQNDTLILLSFVYPRLQWALGFAGNNFPQP